MHKIVTILSATPALSELLADLVRQAGLQVAVFESAEALSIFMRISPVQLVIIDTEFTRSNALDVVAALRANRNLACPIFSVLAITRAEPAFHAPLLVAGVDEVLTKPIVAGHFLRRIAHHLAADAQPYPRRRRPIAATQSAPHHDNVVQLFAARR